MNKWNITFNTVKKYSLNGDKLSVTANSSWLSFLAGISIIKYTFIFGFWFSLMCFFRFWSWGDTKFHFRVSKLKNLGTSDLKNKRKKKKKNTIPFPDAHICLLSHIFPKRRLLCRVASPVVSLPAACVWHRSCDMCTDWWETSVGVAQYMGLQARWERGLRWNMWHIGAATPPLTHISAR